ncbi:ThiF family adenylyltransferase [Pseudomonas sp. PNP]|uniref:ThiF family adenylyltransferase n=1 Tax=Pseudomonas sp. PNP TaxID=361819 RepID=UPI001AECD90E|nr:ThiF family adenylyltransferase [Pseudomonas sp. PNP]MBP2840535.1 ThiF family adenylyltransferase [Pseudomonas sp. PNP]
MNALVDSTHSPEVERGIAALNELLGKEAAALLNPEKTREDEVACFSFPIPADYTGTPRTLRIAFPRNFPLASLRLNVEPSPWLEWPHAMKSGLCLHGFREKPITGTPETVVQDSFSRFSTILNFVVEGSDPAIRHAEFHREITSYWNTQLGVSPQDLLLLERPKSGSELYATSDPRPSRRNQTAWLATSIESLRVHFRRIAGLSAKIRSPAVPGFYVKLQTFPSVRIPVADRLIDWLTPHLSPDDCKKFLAWFSGHGSLANRWIVLELPGPAGSPVYCLDVRSYSKQPDHGRWYGFRTARRWSGKNQPNHVPVLVRGAIINILDRNDILSRDLSGTAVELEKARVVMIGVGSLGSTIAQQLARSGIGEIVLIDPDMLESANLGRHVLGADDLGKWKAIALAEKITRDLPTVKAIPYVNYAEILLISKPGLFENADLVIVTTADWSSEVALWRKKSAGTRWGLLQAWSEPHTLVGHALLAPAGEFDARHLFDDSGNFNFRFTEWPKGDGVIAIPACGQSFIPGGASGMANVASMVVQTALRSLTAQLNEQAWISTIYRPQDAAERGGVYKGPLLEKGVQHIVLERDWPTPEGGDA